MAAKFSPGDIVQLTAGGPAKTVAKLINTGGGSTQAYQCEWFKGASKERAPFEEETLKTYVAPTKS